MSIRLTIITVEDLPYDKSGKTSRVEFSLRVGTKGKVDVHLATSDLLTPHAKSGLSQALKVPPQMPADVHCLITALCKRIGVIADRLRPPGHFFYRAGDK